MKHISQEVFISTEDVMTLSSMGSTSTIIKSSAWKDRLRYPITSVKSIINIKKVRNLGDFNLVNRPLALAASFLADEAAIFSR